MFKLWCKTSMSNSSSNVALICWMRGSQNSSTSPVSARMTWSCCLMRITLLVLRHLIAKLVLAHQIAIDEQVHGVVESSATDAMPLRGHVREQRIDVKVSLVRVDFTREWQSAQASCGDRFARGRPQRVRGPAALIRYSRFEWLCCFPLHGFTKVGQYGAEDLELSACPRGMPNWLRRCPVVSMSMKRSSGAS